MSRGAGRRAGGQSQVFSVCPLSPHPAKGGAFSSFNSSARMTAPVLTQTMGCNPLVTPIQWVQPVFANQIKGVDYVIRKTLHESLPPFWLPSLWLLLVQEQIHIPVDMDFCSLWSVIGGSHLGFKEFRVQGQIVETCVSCTSHNPKQECTSELVGPAICLQHWTKKIKSKRQNQQDYVSLLWKARTETIVATSYWQNANIWF